MAHQAVLYFEINWRNQLLVDGDYSWSYHV